MFDMLRPPSEGRHRPVAHFLGGLVLACFLPGIVGISGFLLAEYQEERLRQVEETMQIAQFLGHAVDTEIARVQALARSLASSEELASGALDAFSRHAARATAAAGTDSRVLIYKEDGSRLLAVPGADGRPVPATASAEVVGAVFRTRRAQVSNVVLDGVGGAHVDVLAPVFGDGKVRYALAIAVPSTQLTAVLVARHLPDEWLASLLDRNGIIAARNRGADRFVGLPAAGNLRAMVAQREGGSLETLTRDGVNNFTVFARSPRTGYATIVGIPKEQILAPLRDKLFYLAALAALLFGAGLLLARHMSRRISGSIHALMEPAIALGHGTPPAIPPVHLSEAVKLGAAIERAAALLEQRDAALRAQHDELQQFKFFSENANDMLLLLDEQGHIRYANRMASERLGYGNAELLSMTLYQIDLPVTPERFRLVFAQCRREQPPPFERTYRCKDGAEIPVEITATVLEHKGEWLMHVVPRDIAERRQAEQAIRWAASHDALTGLANRTLALESLEQALADARAGAPGGAVLFIDLDRFKPINDFHGHEVGDHVLRELARRLQERMRPGDLLARIGGDEFLAILRGQEDEQAARMAGHVIDAVSRPVAIGNIEAALSASVGISRFPEHGNTAGALIHAADMAMLHAKHAGRAAFACYSPGMDAQAQFTLSVERRLRHALEHGGMAMHYQPIVNLATGGIEGVEALVRLEDGASPAVGPGTFVPIAESTGLIVPLGAWAAHEACRQQASWEADGLALTVAVNVSALQFRRTGFAQRVRNVIEATGIDPHRLVIELTETAVMQDLAETIEILHEIKALGVRIALDDFGTGYSSLSSLSVLPLDKLKIDQSFVRGIGTDHASRAVIDAVVALARSLDLELVAEGIETEAALQYLRERGCHYGQGYHFSRPLPQSGLEAWHARYRAHGPAGCQPSANPPA